MFSTVLRFEGVIGCMSWDVGPLPPMSLPALQLAPALMLRRSSGSVPSLGARPFLSSSGSTLLLYEALWSLAGCLDELLEVQSALQVPSMVIEDMISEGSAAEVGDPATPPLF